MQESVLENRNLVDQKFRDICDRIESRLDVFAHQGTIVESWRTYSGRKLGPYYRLSYRDGEKQQSIYLGKSKEFADRVKQRLDEIQSPVKQQRRMERIISCARAELREHKRRWNADLEKFGLSSKGYEVRGWRREKTKKRIDADNEEKRE